MRLRTSTRTAGLAVVCFAAISPTFLLAQATTGTSQARQSAPAAQASPAAPVITPLAPPPPPPPITLPTPNPANFTATSPTAETVNAFLKASWGFDPNRVWQVEAILKTTVPGLSKVVVAVAEKGAPQGPGNLQFFVLPDGKHLVADDVLPFGSNPFEETRKTLAARADGPSRGAAGKDLLFVEFSDFQCPHCKDAQATVDKLLQEYPNARFVYENMPLVQIHTEAYKAASYSVCVDKVAGDSGFFKFATEVFANQPGLTPAASDKTLRDAATKAGADADKVAACSATAATKAAVDASMKLATDLGVVSTPTLYVNGRALPLGGPYEQLKTVIAYQLTLDGVRAPEAASASASAGPSSPSQ